MIRALTAAALPALAPGAAAAEQLSFAEAPAGALPAGFASAPVQTG